MHFGMHIAWAALNWELKCLPFSILFPTATTLCNKSTSLLNTDPLNTTIFCTMLLHAVLSQGIVFLSGYLLALCKGKPKQEAWGWEEKNNGCGEGRIMENQEVRKKTTQVLFKWEGQPSLQVTAYASKRLFFHWGQAEAADAVCLMPMRTEKPWGNGFSRMTFSTRTMLLSL